jgi:hypothetical protein
VQAAPAAPVPFTGPLHGWRTPPSADGTWTGSQAGS